MNTPIQRRKFLKQTAIVGAGLATIGQVASLGAAGANKKIVVAS